MLREAEEKDVEAIFALISWAAKTGKVLPRSKEEIASVINHFFIWQEKNKVVGCCSLDIYSQKMAEIRSLVVLPKYQKNGIGSKLVSECLKRAKRHRIYEVLSVTDKDIFFEKLGFRKCLNNQWPMFIKP